ncbi:hypothetical protein KF840_04605 [bacterium]|nr:hypothetical protein [bacterium]
MEFRNLLLAIAMIVMLTARAEAGAGFCCVCECGSATACTPALGPGVCDEFVASGCGLGGSQCEGEVIFTPCADLPVCAVPVVQPTPAGSAVALGVAALLLCGIAAWRLRDVRRLRTPR